MTLGLLRILTCSSQRGKGNGKKTSKRRAAELILDQSRQLPLIARDGNHRQIASPTNTTLYGDPHSAPQPPFLDLPSSPDSDNEDPSTYVPSPMKFSTFSPGYAPSPPQIHPSSYNYAPSSPRYSPSSPFDAPTSPKFSIFSIGYAPSPRQPKSIGKQTTHGIQMVRPDKSQQPPFFSRPTPIGGREIHIG